jgi:hypothetical protein
LAWSSNTSSSERVEPLVELILLDARGTLGLGLVVPGDGELQRVLHGVHVEGLDRSSARRRGA